MIAEYLLTEILKWKYARDLQLDRFDDPAPPEPKPDTDYLIYIHVPFCEELCPYCSFNRVPFENDLARRYFDALRREIAMYADLGFDFVSAYVGGGTPTVLPQEMCEVLHDLKSRFTMKEISLETNPNHLTDDIMKSLRDAGVNRLSVGVQSFDDSLLKQMERYHKYGSGEEIARRIKIYTGTFDTLNVDMIFNFPTQTQAMLERDLEILTGIPADQVTFYPLMVSDITKKELAERFGPIGYRTEKKYYETIVQTLGDDYAAGTAWCFSRKESLIDEYIVDYDEYVGVGSGAFGYVNGTVIADTFSIPAYIDAVNRGKLPVEGTKTFSPKEQMRYDLVMKLFGTTLDLERQNAKYDGAFTRSLAPEIGLFQWLGAIRRENGMLRLTRKGQYYWVIMMREFFTAVNNFRDICRARIERP